MAKKPLCITIGVRQVALSHTLIYVEKGYYNGDLIICGVSFHVEAIAKLCGLDYDKDADEELNVMSVDENITFVTKEDLK